MYIRIYVYYIDIHTYICVYIYIYIRIYSFILRHQIRPVYLFVMPKAGAICLEPSGK